MPLCKRFPPMIVDAWIRNGTNWKKVNTLPLSQFLGQHGYPAAESEEIIGELTRNGEWTTGAIGREKRQRFRLTLGR